MIHLVPNSILRSPRKVDFKPDNDLRRRLILYLAVVYGCDSREIKQILPAVMTRWGKVRIANGGDKIRANCAVSAAQAHIIRDSSYVRVSSARYSAMADCIYTAI